MNRFKMLNRGKCNVIHRYCIIIICLFVSESALSNKCCSFIQGYLITPRSVISAWRRSISLFVILEWHIYIYIIEYMKRIKYNKRKQKKSKCITTALLNSINT